MQKILKKVQHNRFTSSPPSLPAHSVSRFSIWNLVLFFLPLEPCPWDPYRYQRPPSGVRCKLILSKFVSGDTDINKYNRDMYNKLFYKIGSLAFQTQKLTSTIIKHPKQAWSDTRAGYEIAKVDHEEDERMFEEAISELGEFTDDLLKKEQNKPTQGEFDFGGNK